MQVVCRELRELAAFERRPVGEPDHRRVVGEELGSGSSLVPKPMSRVMPRTCTNRKSKLSSTGKSSRRRTLSQLSENTRINSGSAGSRAITWMSTFVEGSSTIPGPEKRQPVSGRSSTSLGQSTATASSSARCPRVLALAFPPVQCRDRWSRRRSLRRRLSSIGSAAHGGPASAAIQLDRASPIFPRAAKKRTVAKDGFWPQAVSSFSRCRRAAVTGHNSLGRTAFRHSAETASDLRP